MQPPTPPPADPHAPLVLDEEVIIDVITGVAPAPPAVLCIADLDATVEAQHQHQHQQDNAHEGKPHLARSHPVAHPKCFDAKLLGGSVGMGGWLISCWSVSNGESFDFESLWCAICGQSNQPAYPANPTSPASPANPANPASRCTWFWFSACWLVFDVNAA
jgi:hypothetical protein